MADGIVDKYKKKATDVSAGGSGKSVWLGSTGGKVTSTYSGGVPITTQEQQYSNVDKMKAQVLAWNGARSPMYDDLVGKLLRGGFISKSYIDNADSAATSLEKAINVFQAYNSGGGTLGFDDWLDWYSSTGVGDKSGGGAYTGPVTTTTTTVYDDRAAETVLQKMARETFGRNLTKSEAKRYAKELQAAQRENPTVTRSEGNKGVRSSTSTTAVGGEVLAQDLLTAEDEAIDFAAESTGLDQMWNSINRGLDVMYGR